MKRVEKSLLAIGVAMGLAFSFSGQSWAQQRAVQTKEGASIIVDGVVREVFHSHRQNLTDFVVQIDVARSEYGRAPADPRRVQAPAPGDQIYIHVFQPSADPHRSTAAAHNAIPAERSQVRAYLYPRQQGGWEGAFPDWFDATRVPQLDRGPSDPEPPAEAATAPAPVPAPTHAPAPAPAPSSSSVATTGSILQKLGIRAEQIQVSGRLVLKVIDLVPDGPAAKAGIEVDDTLIGINGGFITDLDQLAATIQKGGPVATMAVLDHRTNQTQPVKVDVSGIIAAQAPQTPQPAPTPAPPARTLGVKLEQVRLGLRTTAVRVTEVQEGSPAAKAGIEPGDVLLSADGTPAETPDQFIAVVQKSGPVLNLKVFDPRTRREVPVQVHFEAVAAAPTGSAPAPENVPQSAPAPTPTPSSGPTSARALGIVAEAGTADLLPVVKVVQVVPGSPAEKAGIEPGDAIVGLNDKVVFAPELLDEALRTAGTAFTLNVLDVKTGKKTPVKINIP
jgi:S1-C subfamily serine protease